MPPPGLKRDVGPIPCCPWKEGGRAKRGPLGPGVKRPRTSLAPAGPVRGRWKPCGPPAPSLLRFNLRIRGFESSPSRRIGRLRTLMTFAPRRAPRVAACGRVAGFRGPTGFLWDAAEEPSGRWEGCEGRLRAPMAEAAAVERSRRVGGLLASSPRFGVVEKGRSLVVEGAFALRPRTTRTA